MDIADLIADAKFAGLTITVDGDKLVIKAANRTAESNRLANALGARKEEVKASLVRARGTFIDPPLRVDFPPYNPDERPPMAMFAWSAIAFLTSFGPDSGTIILSDGRQLSVVSTASSLLRQLVQAGGEPPDGWLGAVNDLARELRGGAVEWRGEGAEEWPGGEWA
jgi:hypothetical protein